MKMWESIKKLISRSLSLRIEAQTSGYDRVDSFTLRINRRSTIRDLKQSIAVRLSEPSTSNIDILDGTSVLELDGDQSVEDFRRNQLLRVRVTRDSFSIESSHTGTARQKLRSPLNLPNHSAQGDVVSDCNLPLVGQQLHEARKERDANYGASSINQSNHRQETIPVPSSNSTQSTVLDYGRIMCRGTTPHATVSAATTICLAAAQWFLQLNATNDYEDLGLLSSQALDAIVSEGFQYHSTLRSERICLDDLWVPSCPFIKGMDRSIPNQSKVSTENYQRALTSAWEFAVGNGQHTVAVLLNKPPETILCFARSREAHGGTPEWYLFDSHGDMDRVAYVLRVPSTTAMATALGVKYPAVEMDNYQEWLSIFETTSIIKG